VPSKRRPAPPKLEAQAIVKPTCQVGDAQAFDAASRDFDRKRDAVQPAAEIGDNRGFRVRERKPSKLAAARSTNSFTAG
jgi:hypothetical protein